MNDELKQVLDQMKVDRSNLYREEMVTDLRVASIRRLIPIKEDGSPDTTRREVFLASTQIMSPQGTMRICA